MGDQNTNDSEDMENILTRLNQIDFSSIKSFLKSHEGEGSDYKVTIKSMYEVLCWIRNYALEIEKQEEKILSTYQERSDSINSIVHANGEITQGLKRQSESTEKCAGLAKIFQNHFESMLQTSDALGKKANDTANICKLSEKSIKDLLDISKKSQNKFLNIVDKVSKLAKCAEHINSIVGVIIRVARETNLLSINASIEAARAGMAGKGFAVVAEEIKRLAEGTQKEGEEISQLVHGITGEINTALGFSEEARRYFKEQDQDIENSNHALTDISDAMKELVKQQAISYNMVEKLLLHKNELVASISDIVRIAENSAAVSQMVSSISMEQSGRDSIVLEMIRNQQREIGEVIQALKDIEAKESHIVKPCIGFTSLEEQEFYSEVEEAAKETCSKLNIELISRSPKRYNVEEQIRMFNELVESKVEGIIVVPSDAVRFGGVINKAVEQGIKVICVDIDVPQSRRNIFITSDSYEGGKIAGEAAARHLKGTGNIIALLCAAAVPTVQQRYKGFLDMVSKYPGIKIINKEEQMDTAMNVTRRIIEDMTGNYPNFDLLYLVNSDAGEIAVDVFRRKRLDKKLVILSKSKKITEAIRDGIVSSQIVQRNSLWGEKAALYISRILHGEEILPYEDTGMYEINRSNLQAFESYGK